MPIQDKKLFSVIVAYYKNQLALELIIKALKNQSCTDFEVIIAEDDIKSTFDFVSNNESFPIKHVYQDLDIGFRKNQILNKAITAADGKYIIFIDGDCIPHKHFVKAYKKHMDEDSMLFGRRVMVSEKLTKKLYETKEIKLLTFWNLFISGSTRLKYGIYLPFLKQRRETGIWGHNWAVSKNHLLSVNGFDEDYQTAGVGEDVDIEYRLKRLGLHLFSIRNAAIQYHLHHNLNYSQEEVNIGKSMYDLKVKSGQVKCLNGIVKRTNF